MLKECSLGLSHDYMICSKFAFAAQIVAEIISNFLQGRQTSASVILYKTH